MLKEKWSWTTTDRGLRHKSRSCSSHFHSVSFLLYASWKIQSNVVSCYKFRGITSTIGCLEKEIEKKRSIFSQITTSHGFQAFFLSWIWAFLLSTKDRNGCQVKKIDFLQITTGSNDFLWLILVCWSPDRERN